MVPAQIVVLGSIWSSLRGFRGGAGIRRRQNVDTLSVALRRFGGVRAGCCCAIAVGWPVRLTGGSFYFVCSSRA